MSAPPPNVGSATPAQSARKATSKAKPREKAEEPAELPPGSMIVGGADPNFYVLPSTQAAEKDRFVMATLPIGLNSTFVTVETPAIDIPATAAPLPEGYRAEAGSRYSSDGWPMRITGGKSGKPMAYIPAGPFVQGVDQGPASAGPKHVIDLDSYYIDVFETTVGDFMKYREALKADKKPMPAAPSNAGSPPETPVLGVLWRDAVAYAKWIGKELPTEAEWEKAARGTTGSAFPWGESRPVWERSRELGQIDPVGSFRLDESPFGVRDVAGNAREWTLDWYADDAFAEFQKNTGVVVRNWTGPKSDKQARHVVKGGKDGWEPWRRGGAVMKDPHPDVGFRCVLRIKNGKIQGGVADANDETETPAAAGKGKRPSAPSPGF
jgi:formylglycine-generating enzyme required for sulfatase activity